MGSESVLQSGRSGAPKALKRAFRLAVLVALALGFAPKRAAAQAGCPGTVAGSYTLTQNITAASTDTAPCITIGAPNTTINLAGFTIDVSAMGDNGVAINAGAYNNTSIIGNGGAILTGYIDSGAQNSAGIEVSGGSGLTITGVKIYNETSSTPLTSLTSLCESPQSGTPGGATSIQEYGMGISVNGVTGATISSNEVCFYQYGIFVQNSAIASKSSGSISGNLLNWDTYYMYGSTGPEIYSAGVVLSNSSGWTVSGNTVYDDGATSPNGTCTSPTSTTGLNTCSFGLQVINGSSSNSISSNTVEYNFVGGIYTGVDTSGNKITGNTSLQNALWDMWDDAPAHSNAWHHNTCGSAGGTLPARTCRN